MSITNLGIQSVRKGATVEQPEELDAVTGWPKGILDGLGWVGDRMDDLDKAVGVPGTDLDVYHARKAPINWLDEKHFVLGLMGEIFIPDSIDIASWGLAYIPNRFRKSAKLMKLWGKMKGKQLFPNRKVINAAKKDWVAQVSELGGQGLETAARIEKKQPQQYLMEQGLIHGISKDPWSDAEAWARAGDDFAEAMSKGSDWISPLNRKVFEQAGLTDEMKLLDEHFGGLNSYSKRNLQAATADPIYDITHFKKIKEEAAVDFAKEFSLIKSSNPGLTMEVHHITPLAQVMPLFMGLSRKERRQMLRYLINEGIFAGHNPKNLMALPAPVHRQITSLLRQQLGQLGELFWDGHEVLDSSQKITRIKEFSRIIKESQQKAIEYAAGFKDAMNEDALIELAGQLEIMDRYKTMWHVIKTGRYPKDKLSPEMRKLGSNKSRIKKRLN